MHILIFPQREYPCDHAMLETVFSRLLPARGHRISWIMRSARASTGPGPVPWNESRAYLVPTSSSAHRGGRLDHAGARILRYAGLAEAIHRAEPVDVIHVRNELSAGLVALYMRLKSKIPFVFQLSFPIAGREELGSLVDGKRAGPTGTLRASLKRNIQSRILSRADLVLAISPTMREALISRGIPPQRVVSVPMGFDTDIRPDSSVPTYVRTRFGLGDSPLAIYFGALDRIRRLDFVLAVMEMVRREIPNVRLLILGAAADPVDAGWLRSEVDARGLGETVVMCGRVPRAEVPAFISAASVSLSPIPPIPAYIVSSPTKVIESLGLGVPVVANIEIPEQRAILEASRGGICVSYNVGEFASAVSRLLRNPELAAAAGRSGRQYVIQHRSYTRLSTIIEKAYVALTGPPGGSNS